jgi:hypothetical protein
MTQANLDVAHKALQSLKNNPPALSSFHQALSGLSRDTGLAFDDPTLTYVANALINQRNILAHANVRDKAGSTNVGGFYIKASVE